MALFDLTAFQRDLMYVIAQEEAQSGLDIKSKIEPDYEQEIHHGRLYPNLDELVETGLIRKGERDQRTNTYDISQDGVQALQERREWEDNLAAQHF